MSAADVPLRDRRLALGLTQQALADSLGVTQRAAAQWETRGRVPERHEAALRGLEDAAEAAVDSPTVDLDGLPDATRGVVSARRATRDRT